MKRAIIWGGLLTILLGFVYGAYILLLYRETEAVFLRQESFKPTKIYSDVTRIAPPQIRGQIEEKLKALAYTSTTSSTSEGEVLSFRLRTLDFPEYLIPEDHPTLAVAGQMIQLLFDRSTADASLLSIRCDQKEIPELYLEPEFVAAMTKSGVDSTREIREHVPLSQIPAPVWQAIISIEDQHFLEHKGFSVRGTARAVWVNLKTHSLAQGGSTITQQLVKNLMARRNKNIFLKLSELFIALILELRFEKNEILERYLNEVYLGQVGTLQVHGVAEGARHFFGKNLQDLNLAEMAMMAGLIRGPGFYAPHKYPERAEERKRLVLRKMTELGAIAPEEEQEALKQIIRLAPPRTVTNKAPFFVDYVKSELIRLLDGRTTPEAIPEAGLKIYTTMNLKDQLGAQKVIALGVARVEERFKLTPGTLEGALASVDQNTGKILTLVGGRNFALSTFNRILNMRRQVGSTFKPLVYLAAFEKGRNSAGIPYSAALPVDDSPWTLTFDRGLQHWAPSNYEDKFSGWIPMRQALAHSINVPTARLGISLSIPWVMEVAKRAGLPPDLPPFPSLSLGIAELKPVELLQAYATIANRGVKNQFHVIRAILDDTEAQINRYSSNPEKTLNPQATDLLIDLLSSVFTEGTAASAKTLGWERPAAGKTGTTSNYRDSWFAGFTPQLTSVVWVGMDKDQDKLETKLTGANAALPIWLDYMKLALEGEPPLPFQEIENLKTIRLDRKTGLKARENCPEEQVLIEKVNPGNEPEQESCAGDFPVSEKETRAD